MLLMIDQQETTEEKIGNTGILNYPKRNMKTNEKKTKNYRTTSYVLPGR